MSEQPSAVFAVTCARYRATLLTTRRISDPELQQMENHLRVRHPDLRLGTTAASGQVLDHFRVMPTPTEN